MREMERELEIARMQAEIERARAEAVVSHLAVENQQLQTARPPLRQTQPRPRRNAIWRLAGHLVARLGSMVLGLVSCISFLVLLLLVYAYWPEISRAFSIENLPFRGTGN